MKERSFAALTAIFAIVAGGLVAPTAAMAASDDAVLSNEKTVVGTTTEFRPRDRFDYEIQVGCSSTTSPGCVDAFLLDTLPAPLVLDPDVESPVVVSVAGGAAADIAITTDEDGRESFRIDPKQAFGTGIGAGTGIAAGGSMLVTVTVSVFVPTTTSGEFNGATVTNTAAADATNAPEAPSKVTITNDAQSTVAAACAQGCDGRFGGYTLTTPERADALGVRITFSERTAGAGVGSSYERRPIDLVFEVRDTLRSDPTEWVLGEFHDGTYNTGTPGLVNNSASARGVNTSTGVDVTSRANDDIQIIDSPVNVALTKAFDQDLLGVPQAGTAQEGYPLISSRLVATNTSATRVSTMVITDPAASQTAPTAFDVLNLYSIDGVTAPT